jgi:hypothetical protein
MTGILVRSVVEAAWLTARDGFRIVESHLWWTREEMLSEG